MQFCNTLIARKIESCIATLEQGIYRSEVWDKAMDRANADLATLARQPPTDVASLVLLEANGAAAYFRARQKIPNHAAEREGAPICHTLESTEERCAPR
jgi:hypothetical protein